MADNFLEKQYAKHFGDSSTIDPETGYTIQKPQKSIIRKKSIFAEQKSTKTTKHEKTT